MSQNEFDDIFQKYLDGKCTPAEAKIVLEWYDSFISESVISISPREKKILEQKILAAIKSGAIGNTGNKRAVIRPLRSRWFRVAAAACLAVIIGGGYWFFYMNKSERSYEEPFVHVRVPKGYLELSNAGNAVQPVHLADGSLVELQAQSALYYPAQFNGATRTVYLKGNAFFKVAHDTTKHFIVQTDEGLMAEVLGTSFYVFHDRINNKVEVSVVTGRVSVYDEKSRDAVNTLQAGNRIILTPNQKVSYKPVNNQFVTSLVEEPKPIETGSVKQAEPSFVFDESPLSDVLNALQTTYGITIETENNNLNNCHFTGDISRQSLYDKLDILCKSTQCSYEVKGTSIYIRGKGCN